MRFSLTSLIRLFVLSMIGLGALAIGLGRMSPAPRHWRSSSEVRFVSLNGYHFSEESSTCRWLDLTTGKISKLAISDQESLECASGSPWKDESGQSQVIGRWTKREGKKVEACKSAFGLARVRFPSGEVLDRFETDIVPIGVPCWYEAPSARVLFGAADGNLYDISFDTSEQERAPKAIRWAVPPPGLGHVFIGDPAWISNSPKPRVLAVSMRTVEMTQGRRAFSTLRLYWLKLNDDGTAIVAAGLLGPGSSNPPLLSGRESEERCPTFHLSPDGRRSIAYLRKSSSARWDLRVTEVELDGQGLPFMRREGAIVSTNCMAIPPAFSLDGRTINALKGEGMFARELVKVSVDPERSGLASHDRLSTEM